MAAHTEHHVPHPTPKQYVQIALFLAVLTAIEVLLYYVEQGVDAIGTSVTAPLLILLALIKFFVVVAWYMHLRFEKAIMTKFFSAGAILALVLYAATLIALGAIAIGA